MAISKKGFSIAHLNVRRLTKNLNETLVTMKGFDVIGISETWLHDLISSSQIGFDGYKIYRQDRGVGDHTNKKRGGGLVLYVKDGISPFSNQITQYCKSTCNLEQVWIEICKPNFKRQFVGVIYRPPEGSIKEFISELDESLEMLDQSSSAYKVTILGDFNINYSKSSTPEFKALKEFERKSYLKQYIKNPTRVTNTVQSTIDLVFSNMAMIAESRVMKTMIADHFPIYIVKKKDRNDKSFTHSYGRSYKNYNTEVFQDLIRSNLKWRAFWIRTNNPDDLWDIMLTV